MSPTVVWIAEHYFSRLFRRAKEDQDRSVTRSGKNVHGDRNDDDDMDGGCGDNCGNGGDSDGDVVTGRESGGSSSSSRTSMLTYPSKYLRKTLEANEIAR
ncbi:hypothetical protein DFQ27_002870, partial [Actinomortierella ambigua]